jgi:hypothetical protein
MERVHKWVVDVVRSDVVFAVIVVIVVVVVGVTQVVDGGMVCRVWRVACGGVINGGYAYLILLTNQTLSLLFSPNQSQDLMN